MCVLSIIDESIQEAFMEQSKPRATQFVELFTAKGRDSDLENVQLSTSACL